MKNPSPAKKAKTQKKQNKAVNQNLVKVFDYSMVVLFMAFITILTTFKLFLDDDVFWHLATGRFIVQNGYIPSTDVFGFITAGTKWIPFEWGWDVLTYLIY